MVVATIFFINNIHEMNYCCSLQQRDSRCERERERKNTHFIIHEKRRKVNKNFNCRKKKHV